MILFVLFSAIAYGGVLFLAFVIILNKYLALQLFTFKNFILKYDPLF